MSYLLCIRPPVQLGVSYTLCIAVTLVAKVTQQVGWTVDKSVRLGEGARLLEQFVIFISVQTRWVLPPLNPRLRRLWPVF
jgi:hypothetical protein